MGHAMQFVGSPLHRPRSTVFWGVGVAMVLVVGLVGILVRYATASTPSVPGVTPAQLAAVKVTLQLPQGATPALASVGSAESATEAHLTGWKLLGGTLASYQNSSSEVTCAQCWIFDAVPPWGLYAVTGRSGPTQPCYQNDGVLTFFLVVVNADSGQVVDMVGSDAQADGQPLPLGPRVSCPTPPGPSS